MQAKTGTADVVIVAAGSGTRMRTRLPKQFLHLAGKPVLLWSLETFDQHAAVQDIVVVGPADWISYIESEIVQGNGLQKIRAVVPGGERRQDSVLAGLNALEGDGAVLVHDAARPMLTPALIDRVLAALGDADAVVPALPVADTVKRVDDDEWVVETPERERLRLVQTPQAFRRAELRNYFERAATEGLTFTDEATLVERYGGRVRCVAGEESNLKITRRLDLRILEMLLEEKRA